MVRARYSSLGTGNNPYLDQEHRGERLPTLAGIMYAVGVPAAVIPLVDIGHGAWAFRGARHIDRHHDHLFRAS